MENTPEQPKETATEEPEEELLYHYTDQAGLLGILKTESIWATHVKYLNDLKEFKTGVELITKIVAELRKGGRIDSHTEKDVNFLLELLASFSFYVSSFSHADKGDSLSLWRGYASSMPGYSLGFSRKLLKQTAALSFEKTSGCITFLQDVFYVPQKGEINSSKDYENAREEILQVLKDLDSNNCIKILDSASNKITAESAFNKNKEAVTRSSLLLLRVLPALKDASFSNEMEARIVHAIYDESLSYKSNLVEFHCGTWSIVPHVKIMLPLKDTRLHVLEKITVGPCPHPEEAKDAVKMLLQSKGITGVQVKNSKIPYRNW